MDIKAEPKDDLLATDITFDGVGNERISTDSGDRVHVKIEKFDDEDFLEVEQSDFAISNKIKDEEEDFQKKNGENNAGQNIKMEQFEAAECSYAVWRPDQEASNYPMGIKKEEEDDGLRQFGDCSQYAEWMPDKPFTIEDKFSVKNEHVPSVSSNNQPSSTYKKQQNKGNDENSKRELVAVILLEKGTFYERNFVCRVCFDIFESFSSLRMHRIVHSDLNIDQKNMIISRGKSSNLKFDSSKMCFKSGTLKINQNVREDSNVDQKNMIISRGKSSKLKLDSSKMRYKCDQCDFTAYYFSQVTSHKKAHLSEKPLKCGLCDFKTAYVATIKKHKLVHTGEKPYKCEQCEYKTTNSSNFKLHKLTTHSAEKPFSCDVCEFKCVQAYQLTRHKLTHTAEKPLKCDQCSFKCRESSHLKSHKRIHTGEKPFQCDQCSFKSAYSTCLKSHKLSHSGD